jgi:hypothetical protein
MKKEPTSLFLKLNNEELENLTTIVIEKLATGINHPIGRLFTTTDLWNIQRQGKKSSHRRKFE